ncbi:MAG TPA: hypothetical protein VGO46_18805 [Gemmatimonadaceae bacterium]|nr:hypothetical protein [Gemmatimonadaceae bacterium]
MARGTAAAGAGDDGAAWGGAMGAGAAGAAGAAAALAVAGCIAGDAGACAGGAGRCAGVAADGDAGCVAGAADGDACEPGADGIDGIGADGGANGDMRGAPGGAADGAGATGAAAEAAGAMVAGAGATGAGAGATGARIAGVGIDGAAGIAARSCGGVTADGRDGMLVSADVRGCCADGAPACDANPACIGCGGVGIETGGRGGSGAATDGRWRAGVCDGCGNGVEAVKSSSMRPRSPIAITPPHTEHRARTPASGILAGSTRKTELHSGQVTFMRWRSRESCSVHRSETPTGEPRIGSCRRSTT